MTKVAKAMRELRALYRVSQAVSSSLELEAVTAAVLAILAEELAMQRGTLALLDPQTGELAIEVAHGLTEAERRRGRYRAGEGVMGRVLETGEPLLVPSIGDEPLFLNRTGAQREISHHRVAFLCVPVVVGGKTVGVLSADRLSGDRLDLEEDLRLLTTVAGVVAQAVRIQTMVRQEKALLQDANRNLRVALAGTFGLAGLVGRSPAVGAVLDQVRLAARVGAPVLLTGEPGTGKGAVAKALHLESARGGGPFVRLACGSGPEPLLAAALLGDLGGEPLAPVGLVAQAEGGTLFLDDVEALPGALQGRLLALLRDRTAQGSPGEPPRRVDVRVVAATTADLAGAARDGRFLPDLYHRLNAVPIHLPPLRERRHDVTLLAEHFRSRVSGAPLGFAPAALERLAAYPWPGNVAELEAVVEEAAARARGDRVEARDLPPRLTPTAPGGGSLEEAVAAAAERLFEAPPAEGVYRAVVDRVEAVLLARAVERSDGVRLQAAKLLGINRNTLYAKLDRSTP